MSCFLGRGNANSVVVIVSPAFFAGRGNPENDAKRHPRVPVLECLSSNVFIEDLSRIYRGSIGDPGLMLSSQSAFIGDPGLMLSSQSAFIGDPEEKLDSR